MKRILNQPGKNSMDRFAHAAEVARLRECNTGNLNELLDSNVLKKEGLLHPVERCELTFDSLSDAPERIYFHLIDLLEHAGWKMEKLTDALYASAGSDLSRQLDDALVQSQDHAARLFRTAQETLNRLLRSLEELRTLDEGHPHLGGVNQPSADAAGPRLAKSLSPEARLGDIRRSLLISGMRTQLVALKAYARWLRPFLDRDRGGGGHKSQSADLVAAFNTSLFKIEAIARNDSLLEEEFSAGNLPHWMASQHHRRAVPVLIIEASFRTVPGKSHNGGFHHRGRIWVCLTSYALREEELRLLRAVVEHHDLHVLMRAAGVFEEDVLENLEIELARFSTGNGDSRKGSVNEDTNPFSALWGLAKMIFSGTRSSAADADDELILPLSGDSFPEQVIRSRSLVLARRGCRETFSALKIHLDMAAPSARRV
ncbi:MAG: hypothetical protein KJ072_01290 [Verrucomicrobia bacterium]|nr:hypothetical protein [Verrucomicrobiota bacterium]